MIDVNDKLTEENLPESYASQQEFANELIEHMKNNPETAQRVSGGELNYILYWKVDVGGLSIEQVEAYLEQLEKGLSTQLDKYNCISFYQPVTGEPTSLTVVNAQTMKYVKI